MLELDFDAATIEVAKKSFLKMYFYDFSFPMIHFSFSSRHVHPDKNPDFPRAVEAFDFLKKV